MAGCWVLVTRATPAVGRRAGGAVKAAAVAAKATINFIVQNLSAGSFTTRAPRLDGDLVSLVRLKNASKKKNSVAKNRLSAFCVHNRSRRDVTRNVAFESTSLAAQTINGKAYQISINFIMASLALLCLACRAAGSTDASEARRLSKEDHRTFRGKLDPPNNGRGRHHVFVHGRVPGGVADPRARLVRVRRGLS